MDLSQEPTFKTSIFHAVEGLKAIELPATIEFAREKLESVFRDKESMRDLLKSHRGDFVAAEDLNATLKLWYEKVSRQLITNKTTDFKKLDDFVLNSILMLLPITQQERIGKFRKQQLERLQAEEVLDAEYVAERIAQLPPELDKLIVLKQKLLKKPA